MRGGELVVGAPVRPDKVPLAVEHDEGVQIESTSTIGMSKIAHNVNLILIVAGP
jgi:hypothetical protein